jgi:hypothetical protein
VGVSKGKLERQVQGDRDTRESADADAECLSVSVAVAAMADVAVALDGTVGGLEEPMVMSLRRSLGRTWNGCEG